MLYYNNIFSKNHTYYYKKYLLETTDLDKV